MDEDSKQVGVGEQCAVTVLVAATSFELEWHEEWATWDELQQNPELQQLICTCKELLASAGKGMKGKGSATGAAQ